MIVLSFKPGLVLNPANLNGTLDLSLGNSVEFFLQVCHCHMMSLVHHNSFIQVVQRYPRIPAEL